MYVLYVPNYIVHTCYHDCNMKIEWEETFSDIEHKTERARLKATAYKFISPTLKLHNYHAFLC